MDPPSVKFVDFWPNFRVEVSYLWKLMVRRFGAVLSDDPNYLVYSVFGREHAFNPRYDQCVKILWTGENVVPNFNACDYALSFEYSDDPRNLRWPLYLERLGMADRLANIDDTASGQCLVRPAGGVEAASTVKKTKFCNFVYSDGSCKERASFFRLLSKYKRVDSGGSVENNLGFRVGDKLKFLSDYKFTVAFENSSRDGYVTEKIVDPLLVGSVPIYWGSSRIHDDFDRGCFVSCHDYGSFEEVVDKIVEIDGNDSLYEKYAGAWCFPNNHPNPYCQPDYLLNFLARVFEDRTPRTARRPITGLVSNNKNWEVYV